MASSKVLQHMARNFTRQIFFGRMQQQISISTSFPVYVAPTFIQKRYAGHAKWQNRAPQKKLNQEYKAKHTSVLLAKVKAHYKATKNTDPKKDSTLAKIMLEANKHNVGKTIGTFMKKLGESKGDVKDVEAMFMGPQNTAIVIKGSSASPRNFLDLITRTFRKHLLGFTKATSTANILENQGELVVLASDEMDMDRAEELAIECEAEDVRTETDEDGNESFTFVTAADDLFRVKGALEKQGVTIDSACTHYVPVYDVDLGEEWQEKLNKFISILEDIDDFEQLYTNIKL